MNNVFGKWLSEQVVDKFEFSKQVGISERTIANYINGTRTPNDDRLDIIFDLLGTSRSERDWVRYWIDEQAYQNSQIRPEPEAPYAGDPNASGKLGNKVYRLIQSIESRFGSVSECPEDDSELKTLRQSVEGVM